jgi:dTDP-4-dehydrorhamnose 3,5-epimerase
LKVTPTALPDVLLLEPAVHGDARGFFLESYNERAFREATGVELPMVQDNHSRSGRGVLRGLHYQLSPRAQGKLVRVATGCVFDVAVDMRRGSASLGQWVGVELSGDNHRQLWIPPGFAHGFLVLSEYADFLYKTTNYYAVERERSVRWDDPAIGIKWPLGTIGIPTVSPKDAAAPNWENVEYM